MAPLKPVKNNTNMKRIHAVLCVAEAALTHMNSHLTPSASIAADLASHIKCSLPLSATTSLVGNVTELDGIGTQLWNRSNDLLRQLESNLQQQDNAAQNEDPQRTIKFVTLLRIFAFFLIDAVYQTPSRSARNSDQQVRIFKIGLKAANFCLEKGELELSVKPLERLAEYANTIEKPESAFEQQHAEPGDTEAIKKRLVSEYYLVRITHAWRFKRLDLAEHFAGKRAHLDGSQWPEVAEKAAHLSYEVAKLALEETRPHDAGRWLERAYDSLAVCEMKHLSQDAGELRLSIVASLVKVLLATGDESASQRAWILVEQLETIYSCGNRIVVAVMKLNLLFTETPVRARDAYAIISQMIRSVSVTGANFKTIMHSIYQLKSVDVTFACAALDELITQRLLAGTESSPASEASMQDFLENATVTRTIFATSAPLVVGAAHAAIAQDLQNLFDEIMQHSTRGFSARTTHAIQTLIWKSVSSQDTELADTSMVLLRHPLFDGTKPLDKAKIDRKRMVAAIERSDYPTAHEVFHQMPSASQNESISRYLCYKVAVRSGDYDLAVECLDVVLQKSSKDATFLYACVLEAQQSGNSSMAVAALQAILENGPSGVYLPAVARCTARLLVAELGSTECGLNETMAEVVRVFEGSVAIVKKFKQSNNEQWKAEIHWWSKNAYNLSLKYCVDVRPELLVGLLQACIKFLEESIHEGDAMHTYEVLRRKLLCDYFATSALVLQGRSYEERSKASLQYYLEARKHIQGFQIALEYLEQRTGVADEQSIKLTAKHLEMLTFDLEATLKLRAWQDLDRVLDKCLKQKGLNCWEKFADLVVVIHDEASRLGVSSELLVKLPELLRKVIGEAWKSEKDPAQLARWLRMLFIMNLNIDDQVSLATLQQAASTARSCEKSPSPDRYPDEELRWLAITAFNRGIDHLLSDKPQACREWLQAAIDLAALANDQGELYRVLEEKSKQLPIVG